MLQLKANSVTVVARKDIMLQPASTRTLYAINVGRLAIYRRSAVKRTRPTQSTRPVNNIQDDETDEYQLLNITSSGKVPPWNVCVDIEGVTVSMQLDTGASLSLMAETIFREH